MKPLKAYAVLEDCENTGGIIWAKSNVEARRLGASAFHDGEFSGLTCRRAPWADKYFEMRSVPYLVMIENGWWFSCVHCEQIINSDLEGTDDDDNTITLDPVEDAHGMFCTPACRDDYLQEKAERRMWEQWTVDLLTAMLLKAIPTARVTDDLPYVFAMKRNGLWNAEEATICFNFPGQKIAPAQFKFRREHPKPHASVCAGDLPAFEAWRAAGYPAAMQESA